VILTAIVKGAREGARVKIMPVGCPQTAGRASTSGAGLSIERRGDGKHGMSFCVVEVAVENLSICAVISGMVFWYNTSHESW
jgi:hypothetical protein